MLRRTWMVPFAAMSVALCLLAWSPRPVAAAPAPKVKRPKVEVVFLIDTTGSMSGLIAGAKAKIWTICNQIGGGKPTPDLKVGLVAYRDKGDVYITQVHDLRDDLDSIYAALQTFEANGGGDTPEHVNQGLYDAVHKVSWSTDKRVIKIIFLVGDAPAHMDYTDDVKYPVTCKKAVEKGIIINTIRCGTDLDCEKHWKDIAEKAGGSYATIPQAGGTRSFTTPQDKRLAEINAALLKTVLVWGDKAKRDLDSKKVATARTMPEDAAAERVSFFAKESKVAVYDLLDCIRGGKVKLAGMKDEELPDELKTLGAKARLDFIDKLASERGKLLREAAELDKLRMAAIAKELARNKTSFDAQVMEMLRKQTMRRIRY
jgi:hypothetical protein